MGEALIAYPDKQASDALLALTTTRFGVQFYPVEGMPPCRLPLCPTQRGDASLGPFRRVLVSLLPVPTTFLPDPKGRTVEGVHFFPTLKEVRRYVAWLSWSLQQAASILPMEALVPAVQYEGYSGPSPLRTLLALIRNPVEALCCASNWVHSRGAG
jgi:hypothetical protein